MRDMSNTRKQIAARLGMVARPGAKAKMAAASDIIKMAQLLADVERAMMHDQPEKARNLLKQIEPIVERNKDSRELDSQGMVRAFNDYKKQLGFSRPGAKAEMGASISKHGHKVRAGIMDRIGAAASALTASPADPTSPQYRQQLAAAKKTAQDAVGNYKFMRDKVKGRQDAMDKYVGAAIKTINASTNVQDVEHFAEQIQIAVRALSTMLSSVKTPFARPGAKAEMAAAPGVAELERLYAKFQESTRLFTPNKYRDAGEQKRMTSGQKKDFAFFENLLKAARSGDGKKAKALLAKTDSLLKTHFVPKDLQMWAAQFSAQGAKAKMSVVADERQIGLWMDQVQKNLTRAVNEARALPSGSDEKYAYRYLVQALKMIMRGLDSGDHRMVRNGLYDLKMQAMADMGDDWRNWVPREVDEWVAGGGQMKSARPGASVAFDLWTQIQRDMIEKKAPPPNARAWSAAVTKEIALARDLAANSSSLGTHKALYRQQAEALSLLKTAVVRGDKKYARGIIKNLPTEITKDLPADLIAWANSKGTASRPGAKARHALTDACWQGYEAVGTKQKDGKTVPNCVPKATAAKTSDLEREDVKAGLKLMEKADKAVSDKIRTLIAEGKPQDQAVAIALDMKRRGEL